MNWTTLIQQQPVEVLALAAIGLMAFIVLLFVLLRRRPSRDRSLAPESARPDSIHELGAEDILEQRPSVPTPSVPPPSPVSADSFRPGLDSTRGNLISRLASVFQRRTAFDESVLAEIEEVLITGDVGVRTAEKILQGLKERMTRGELTSESQAWGAIRAEAEELFGGISQRLALKGRPTVIIVVGVNGVGKTTTIGKLASRFSDEGKSVVLAAGDTFRAAAVTQLEVWGRRVGCEVVKGPEKADPGSVIFDAIKIAQEGNIDVVIADTAGRLHTKVPLMDELKKVGRTVEKALGRPPDHVLLVLDATTGQNAIQQVQLFREALPVSGIALTKLDGTAKGGVILGIVDQHQLPVHFVGVGERVEDLKAFDAPAFLEALFTVPEPQNSADYVA